MIHRLKLDFHLGRREERYTLFLKRVQQGTCLEHLEENGRQIIPHRPEHDCHQMISLKLINDLKHEIVLPVSFMNEDATNDLAPVGHVFYCNTFRK